MAIAFSVSAEEFTGLTMETAIKCDSGRYVALNMDEVWDIVYNLALEYVATLTTNDEDDAYPDLVASRFIDSNGDLGVFAGGILFVTFEEV